MAGKETSAIRELTRDGRKKIIQLGYKAGHTGAHFAPSLSLVDVLTVLFTEVMDREKDLFVLSKGHGGLGYYVAMYEAGMITEEQLLTFEDNGGDFPGQPSRSPENGITYSSGSLGLGLGYAAGRAQVEPERRLFCLLGDGELNEGSNWESAMYAGFHKLANLTAIVDYNKMQSDGASEAILEFDIDGAFRAMGWQTCNYGCSKPEDLGTQYTFDAAKAMLGIKMPSIANFQDMVSNCSWTWLTIHGMGGMVVKGTSGFIFLPANFNTYGLYWTSDFTGGLSADVLEFNNNNTVRKRNLNTLSYYGVRERYW